MDSTCLGGAIYVCGETGQQISGYVDFRTLAILFCLMAVVAGFKRQGVFELLAEKLLSVAGSVRGMVTVLVLLCFFMSMVITNDVALITFVPFTIAVMGRAEAGIKERWLLKTVVMQTIAANLGSMLTPIGNPQNLYLFGLSGLGVGEFVWLMLPYTLLSLLLLLGWIFSASRRDNGTVDKAAGSEGTEPEEKRGSGSAERMIAYGVLAVISLLAVGHIIPYWVAFVLVLAYTLCRDSIAAAGERRGRYFLLFTAANLVFLAVLSAAAYLMR